jgi:hypothetical protein
MKTLNQILKKYEFTDYEADDNIPIVSDMYHKDDIVKAVAEWLTQDFIFFSKPEHSVGILAYLDKKIKELQK